MMGNNLPRNYVSVIEQESDEQSELDSSMAKKLENVKMHPSARKSIKKSREFEIMKEKLEKDQGSGRLCGGCCTNDKCTIF